MKRLLLPLLTIVSINMAYAQTYSAADLKKISDDKKFKFTAKQATLPTDVSGTSPAVSSDRTEDNNKTLGAGFYINLTPDSVASYLPYYDKTQTTGVDDQARTSVVDDPTKAVATSYDYQTKQKKSGETIITIKPKGGKITKYVADLKPDGTARIEATIDDYKIIKYDGTYTN